MVAVSTRGWTVSERGEIVPDPKHLTNTEPNVKSVLGEEESSECSECSGCGETSDSDENSSSAEDSEYMESSGDQSRGREAKFKESQWKRPSPALPGDRMLKLISDFVQANGRINEDINATLRRFHGSPPDLINKSFVQWLFVGVSRGS